MMDAAPQDQEQQFQQFQQPEAEADEVLEMEEKRIVIVRALPISGIHLSEENGIADWGSIYTASRCYRNCCFVPV